MKNEYTAEQVEAMADAYFQDTENVDQCGSMLRAYAATLRQQAEQAGGVVSDDKLMDAVQESLLEYRLRNWADEGGDSLSLLDHLSAGETIQSGREEIEQIADAVCEAVAPLLRAPAEQRGRVDGLDGAADRLGDYLVREQSVYLSHKSLRSALQAALAQNALAQQVIDGKAQWDELAGILGADGDNVDDVFAKAKSLTQNTQVGAVPKGTPMMPPGTFFDGCWKRLPESLQGYGRMLTQAWRTADSTELANALKAGVLALEAHADRARVPAIFGKRIKLAIEHGDARCWQAARNELVGVLGSDYFVERPGAPDDAWSRLELWYFRELNSAQRLSLLNLHGWPVDEIGENHSLQKMALRQILATAPSQPEEASHD